MLFFVFDNQPKGMDHTWDEEHQRQDQVKPEMQFDADCQKGRQWWNEDGDNNADDIHESAFVIYLFR